MARFVCIFLAFCSLCTNVAAQYENAGRTQFYLLGGKSKAGATASLPARSIGGGDLGIERVFRTGFGLAGELNQTHDETLAYSVNGLYHFLQASKSGRFVPFVTAGYSRVDASGINGGGGMQIWITDWLGIRSEYRLRKFFSDQVNLANSRNSQTNAYRGWRIGISIRSPK